MNFIEKRDLDLHKDDILLRNVSTRKINSIFGLGFVCYCIDDDMYGQIILNNAIPSWDLGIVIGFEI